MTGAPDCSKDPTFADTVFYSQVPFGDQSWLNAGDITGDGRPDLVENYGGGGYVEKFLNHSDGTFDGGTLQCKPRDQPHTHL